MKNLDLLQGLDDDLKQSLIKQLRNLLLSKYELAVGEPIVGEPLLPKKELLVRTSNTSSCIS
ncbi:MAG: hypothetical protein ABFS56_31340 [Pseudomonadota bacterium]